MLKIFFNLSPASHSLSSLSVFSLYPLSSLSLHSLPSLYPLATLSLPSLFHALYLSNSLACSIRLFFPLNPLSFYIHNSPYITPCLSLCLSLSHTRTNTHSHTHTLINTHTHSHFSPSEEFFDLGISSNKNCPCVKSSNPIKF